MFRLIELIKKNFKLLVRAKVSALVIFLGPLLLVSLLGLAYSQSSGFVLSASVYSGGYSELSESLIGKMINQDFRVERESSRDSCIGSVKRGDTQACIIFPAGMSVEKDVSNEITFYVDYSQINLVWLMLDVMSARVSERSEEISRELTGDILSRMWFIEEKIKAGRSDASEIRSQGDVLVQSSSGMQTGFSQLDISVDFSGIDVDGAKNSSESVKAALMDIKALVSNLSSATGSDLDSIEGSAGDIASMVNDSDVLAETEDIDDAVDEVEDAIESLVEDVEAGSDNASAKADLVIGELEKISLRLSETRSRISDVKRERDDLLADFDSMSASVDAISSRIGSLQGALDEALQKINAVKGRTAESVAAPISTKIEPVSTQKTHFNSLFPTLLVLIIMITGILLASTLTIVDKKSRAFLRNSLTPTSYFMFNLSTYLTSLIVLLVQLLLFVSVSAFFFETEVLASIWLILLLVLLTCTVFICIGMFIGFLFRTEETVTLASITLATVFLLFSSAVIPIESLPAYLKDIAMFNPFVISELAFRQSIVFQLGFSDAMGGLGLLAGYAVGIFFLLVLAQNALRKLSFMHFAKMHLRPSSLMNGKRGRTKLARQDKSSEKQGKKGTTAEKQDKKEKDVIAEKPGKKGVDEPSEVAVDK